MFFVTLKTMKRKKYTWKEVKGRKGKKSSSGKRQEYNTSKYFANRIQGIFFLIPLCIVVGWC